MAKLYSISDEKFIEIFKTLENSVKISDYNATVEKETIPFPRDPSPEYLSQYDKLVRSQIKEMSSNYSEMKVFTIKFTKYKDEYKYFFVKNRQSGEWAYGCRVVKKGAKNVANAISNVLIGLSLLTGVGFILSLIGKFIVTRGPQKAILNNYSNIIEPIFISEN